MSDGNSMGRGTAAEGNGRQLHGVTRRACVLAVASGVVVACAVPGGNAVTEGGVKITQPVTVTLWTGFWAGAAMNERGQGWQDLAGKWNSKNAGDGPKITLALEPTPAGSTTLIEKVTATYSAGSQPDLLHSAYWDAGVYGVQGMAVELDATFIKRDKAYRDSLSDFFPHLLESSRWHDKLWSLPQETNADLPYTNLALVRAAGLQPLKAGYTWDQLVEYLKTLQRSLGADKWAIAGMIGSVQFINLLKQNGGELYDKDHTKMLVNSPEAIEAMQYAADLVHKHVVHMPAPQPNATVPDFRLGQLAMNYETSALRLVQWAESIGGLQNMYVSPSPTKKRPFVGTFGQNTLLFKTTPERQEAAWQVLRYITSTEGSAEYAATTMFLPARRSILKTAAYSKVLKDAPPFQTFVEALDYAYRPFHPEFGYKHYPRFGATATAIWKEPNRSIRDDLNTLARDLNQMLDDFNRTPAGK